MAAPPIRGGGGYGYSLDVRFYYTMDGKDCCATSRYGIYNGDVSLLEYLESSRLDMRLVIRDGYDEKYYDLYPADEEGHRLLAGLWESTRIISRTENGDLLKDESTNAYSITFMEDGTFTAVLDKELQGTWMFYKKSLGLNDSANYHYILCFDDGAYEARALLYGDELSVYTQDQPTSNKVEFIAMTEEAIAKREALRAEVANLVSGEWTGTYGSLQNLAVGSDEIEAYQQIFDYSITFAEDGTFTATLDQDYTGTWTFLESIKVDDPQYAFSFTYMYRLNCDGLLDGAFVSVYAQSATDSYEAKASQSCSLQITYSPDGDDRSGYFNFRQFSPESLQKVQEAAKEIVGSWTAVSATSCTREWSKIKNIPDCKYTLTVYADGTYTVVLDRTYTGTWIYDCNPHPDYDTSYHFSNSNTNSTIELDGTLSFRHYYADGYVEVTFRRNKS